MVEEITIDETPTEVQLSVEPSPLELVEGTQLTEESAAPTSTATAAPSSSLEDVHAPAANGKKPETEAKTEMADRDNSADSSLESQNQKQQEKQKKQENGGRVGAPSASLFGRRALVVRLERIRLDERCMMPSGRVDLKVLKRLRPDLLLPRVPKIALGDRRPSASSSQKKQVEKKRRERKSSTEKKAARKREKKEKKPATVLSSGSDSSDSELEAMRAKMNKKKLEVKPPVLSVSAAKTAPPPSSSAAPAKPDLGRKIVASSSDEEDRKIREKSEKKKRRKDSTSAAAVKPRVERKSDDRATPPAKKSSKTPMSSDSEKEETKPKKRVSAPVSSSDESDRDERAKSRTLASESSGGDTDTLDIGCSGLGGDLEPETTITPPPSEEKKIFVNPLFALKKLMEDKEKAGSAAEAAEEPNVKEMLVEKLYSALSSEDKPDEKTPSPEKQRMVHPGMFSAGSAMRAFRDLLRMELGPSPAFLEAKAAPMPLSEFESIVMKTIDNLASPPPSGQRFLLDPPPGKVNHTAGDDAWFSKHKTLKRCHVVLRDVKKTAGYRSRFARALELHEKDAAARRKRRKERLLQGLRMVKEYSSSNSWQRRKSGDGHSSKFSKLHKRAIGSDSDTDSEDERRRKRNEKWKKKDYDDPNKVQSGFK